MRSFYDRITNLVAASRYEKLGLITQLSDFVRRGQLVLDAGCGRGIDGVDLQEATGCRVIGIDEAADALRDARYRGLEVIRADLNRGWPVKSMSCDAALAIFAVHNIQNKDHYFSEAGRVLNREGHMLLLTATHDDIRRRWLNRFFPSLQKVDIARYPCESDISCLFRCHGMLVREVRHVHIGTEVLDARYVEHVIERRWSSLQLLSDDEFAVGSREFLEFALPQLNTETPVRWENIKTLFIAKNGSEVSRPEGT